MKFPKSETLKTVLGPDGGYFDLEFYGEDEGAAVVSGPKPIGWGVIKVVPEVYRAAAASPAEALAILQGWLASGGLKLLKGTGRPIEAGGASA